MRHFLNQQLQMITSTLIYTCTTADHVILLLPSTVR